MRRQRFALTLENGTLILADYTARVKDTGQIIETTRKTDAENAGTVDPTRTYEPRLIAVGEGWVLKGLDEALMKTEAGQTLDIELPPEKAFGPRDPNKVSRVPVRKFGDKASDLSVGSEVEVDNRIGIIRSLESGRAIVDFNHRYAGKTLLYNIDIKEKLANGNDKIQSLIRRRLPIEKEKLRFQTDENKIKITVPSDYFLLEGLQIIKRAISTDLFKFIQPLESVEFVEDYENPLSKKVEQKSEPTKEAAVEEESKKQEEQIPKKEELKLETGSKEKVQSREPKRTRREKKKPKRKSR